MPGKNEHQITSATVAFLIELGRQIYLKTQGTKIDPVETILSLIIAPIAGAIGGTLPDKFEPATDPNHRDICHSLAGGAALTVGISKIPLHVDNMAMNLFNVALRSSSTGYVTHLAQDARTKKSIPVY